MAECVAAEASRLLQGERAEIDYAPHIEVQMVLWSLLLRLDADLVFCRVLSLLNV